MSNGEWEIHGTWVDPKATHTIFGREHKEFQAFLKTYDLQSEQNINIFVPKEGVIHGYPGSEEAPEGPVTIKVKAGSRILRTTYMSFELQDPGAHRANHIYVEDIDVDMSLEAIPAS